MKIAGFGRYSAFVEVWAFPSYENCRVYMYQCFTVKNWLSQLTRVLMIFGGRRHRPPTALRYGGLAAMGGRGWRGAPAADGHRPQDRERSVQTKLRSTIVAPDRLEHVTLSL